MVDPPSDNEETVEDQFGEPEEDFDVSGMEEVEELEDQVGIADELEDLGLQQQAEAAGPYRDDAATLFSKHTGSVFCVGVEPKEGQVAITGGEDDKAFIWKVTDAEVVLECTGHKDSVACVGFSHDGAYVATGDMAGCIRVWRVATGNEVWSFDVSDLEWLQWHHGAHVLFAGTVDGEMWMWKIPSGDCKTFSGHGAPANIGRLMPDGKKCCVGYEDGTVKVWDLRSGNPVHSISGHGSHDSSVTCMDCHHDNTIVATGSTDQTTKLINTVTGKVVGTFSCNAGASDLPDNSVEALGFCPVNPILAAGNLAGSLVFWDISSHSERLSCKQKAGITRLSWAPASPLIYTSTLDGAVSLWDSRSAKMERQYLGHESEVLDMALSKDGNYILTASDDKTARMFDTRSQAR